ncbi:NAD(P)-dependent oxidoreductase [Steroidobacter sp.]|uniref:NAD(P)-dependent oxidoreductase n=1 Tax=Steroidobacter sp. TaxID=1978227 RepID=UPI001A4F97E1|nr:NAD(P)-binding domain-containing protein [Steroidobacter sp.]MBL8268890.1 NAD(P)-dependent oxidoreductase [Steroidobacter sp.]
MPRPTVTVLGLGRMGSALARALLLRGCDVVVWNRSPARAEPLVASGAKLANSIAEAVAASDLVLICVLDHQASLALLDAAGVAEKIDGRTIVDLTSGLPEELAARQTSICTRGGRFIAGGIMSLPGGIGRMDTLLLYAGDSAAFEAHYPTLVYLGGSAEYLGPDPRAVAHVMSTLGVFVEGTVALFLETSTVAAHYQIPMDRYFRLTRLTRDMLHNQLRECADRVVSRQFGGEEASIDVHLDFVQVLDAAVARTGIPTKLTHAFMEHLQLASSRGYGDCDLAVIAEVLRTESSR